VLVDTHAHLDFPEFVHDIPGVLHRAHEMGVTTILTIGIDLESSLEAARLAQQYDSIFASAGIHPHGARSLSNEDCDTLKALAAGPRVVALGEIGLDFYRDRQPRSSQTRCLRQQLELAVELKSPVIFHIRDAYEEFLRVIGDYPSLRGNGVMHCFSGTWDIAGKCLDLGFYLSVPGTVTFSKAETQQQVARNIPLDRLLVETDAPYLTPVPYRGKVNEPAYVRYTAQKIAELRNSTLEEIAHETTANARRVFSIQ